MVANDPVGPVYRDAARNPFGLGQSLSIKKRCEFFYCKVMHSIEVLKGVS